MFVEWFSVVLLKVVWEIGTYYYNGISTISIPYVHTHYVYILIIYNVYIYNKYY